MDNLKIGKYLKIERKRKNLTQKDFLQNILSVSQYSRIESGEQDIKVTDFIQIMTVNNIDIPKFFN